jgi:hypothetical protein
VRAWIRHECRLRDIRLASSKEAKPSITIKDIEGTGMHCNRYAVPSSPRSCVIPLDRLSGLRQLVEEAVHGAEDLSFVGIEDVVIGVGQTDHLS